MNVLVCDCATSGNDKRLENENHFNGKDSARLSARGQVADIQRVVADPTRGQVSAEQREQSLALRLKETVQDLEIKHPRLMGLLQQIVDRLAEMGI